MGRGGNSDNPFSSSGIDWAGQSNDPSGFKSDGTGSSPRDDWGPEDACYIDSKANKRRDRESKYSSEKTVLDHDSVPSKERAKRSSADEYIPDSWYGGPSSRQEK